MIPDIKCKILFKTPQGLQEYLKKQANILKTNKKASRNICVTESNTEENLWNYW